MLGAAQRGITGAQRQQRPVQQRNQLAEQLRAQLGGQLPPQVRQVLQQQQQPAPAAGQPGPNVQVNAQNVTDASDLGELGSKTF